MQVCFKRIAIVFLICVLCLMLCVPVLAVSVGKDKPSDFKVKQLEISGFDNLDMYLWPYLSRNQSQYGISSPINVVFVGKTCSQVADFMKQRGMGDLFVIAYPEYGYCGQDLGNLSWVASTSLEETRLMGLDGRHHLLLFEGGYSKKLDTYWCYGNIHNDSISIEGHYLDRGSFDDGVRYFNDKLSKKISPKQAEIRRWYINLGNGDDWFFNGNSLLVTWGSSLYKLETE